tara:strand:+ start:481 stop:750 length:270 start_codon:yes stop_codon:yes gene_type:complete
MERNGMNQKDLEIIRAQMSRVGNTDPVAIARRIGRLGYPMTPENVALAMSAIENVRVEVPEPAPKTKRKRKAKAAPKTETAKTEEVNNG